MSVFFLGSWGINRKQIARVKQFMRFACPALRFIPHAPRKKDTHSLSKHITSMFIHNFDVLDSLVGGEWQNRAPA